MKGIILAGRRGKFDKMSTAVVWVGQSRFLLEDKFWHARTDFSVYLGRIL